MFPTMTRHVACVLLAQAILSLSASGKPQVLIENPTAKLPLQLSETGLLEDSDRERPGTHASYEPGWPLWSNGSAKDRRLFLPPGRRVDTSNPHDWKFPVGTIFLKTFSFETSDGIRPIETRILRGLETGWEFAVYEWNPTGTDATLADISSPIPLEVPGPNDRIIRHEIPSRLQCRQCHEANVNFVIGFSEVQLSGIAPGSSASELHRLARAGLFSEPPRRPIDIDDELGSREIRGYIDGNCGHCHNGRERVDLREDVFLRNTLNQQTRGFMFPGGPRIRPGHPEQSLLYCAMAVSECNDLVNAHMPPVGVQEPDRAMIRKLHDWIASLGDQATGSNAEEADLVSRRAVGRRTDRGPGFVPDRHASSLANQHPYAMGFERIALDGDHSSTRGFTSLRFLPNSDLFLLAEHEGRVSLYQLRGPAAHQTGVFRVPNVCAKIECGLVSMELDPDFQTNSLFYVGYCLGDPTRVSVSRFELNRRDIGRTSESMSHVLTVDAPNAQPWHTVGSLLFDRRKALWVLLGDRGLGAPAQDLSNLLGSVIRIQPKRGAGESGYVIPQDNPVGPRNRRRELMAKGLRNPWTGTFDRHGNLWIGEVGQRMEQINFLRHGMGFHNFGWPIHDGKCQSKCAGFADPVIEYTRDGDNRYALEDPGTFPVSGQCVYVGPFYEPRYSDRYAGQLEHVLLFGDFVLGWMRALRVDEAGGIKDDMLLGNMPGITSWSLGHDDYLYVSTYAAYTQDVAGVFRLARCTSAVETHPTSQARP